MLLVSQNSVDQNVMIIQANYVNRNSWYGNLWEKYGEFKKDGAIRYSEPLLTVKWRLRE